MGKVGDIGNEVVDVLDNFIEKVAGRLGVAADAVRPAAKEAIEGYSRQGKVRCAFGAVVMLLGVVFWATGIVLFVYLGLVTEWHSLCGAHIACGIATVIAGTACLIAGGNTVYDAIGAWVSPITSLLGIGPQRNQ